MEEKTVIEIHPRFAEIVTESINSELRQTILEQISKKKCQKLVIVLRDVIISECELRQKFGFEEIKFDIIGAHYE